MKTFFKVVIWMAAAVAGLTVWERGARDLRSAGLRDSRGSIRLLRIVLRSLRPTVKRAQHPDEQPELRDRLEVLDPAR